MYKIILFGPTDTLRVYLSALPGINWKIPNGRAYILNNIELHIYATTCFSECRRGYDGIISTYMRNDLHGHNSAVAVAKLLSSSIIVENGDYTDISFTNQIIKAKNMDYFDTSTSEQILESLQTLLNKLSNQSCIYRII